MDDLQSLYMSLEGVEVDVGQPSNIAPFVNAFNSLVQMLQQTQPYAFSAETENESPTSVNIALNSYRDESGDWRLIDRSKVAWAIIKDDTTGRISLCYCAADVDPIVWFVVAYADASGIVTSTIFTDPVFDSITIRNDGSKDFLTCQRTGGIFPALYTGWGAYIDFTLTYSGATVPDYVFDFTYDTAALVSAGLLQSDGRDIRFYNATTGEDLSYHIKSGINTSSTLFRIKLDNLSTTVALRMYFSNASATAVSTTSIYTFYEDFSSLTAWTNLNWVGASDYVIASSTLKKNVDGIGSIITATPVLLPSTGYCIEATIQTPVTDSSTDIFIGTPARNVWTSPQDFNAMHITYDGVVSAYNAVQRFSWNSWTNLDWGSVADTASNEFRLKRDATHNIALYKNNVLDASAISSTVLDCGTSRYVMVYVYKQNTIIDSIAVYPYITTPPVVGSPGAIVYGPQVLAKVDKDGYGTFKRLTLATGETVSDITKDNTLATASDTQLATTLAISGFISTAVSSKADKIIPAVVGNLAGLSSTGNLTDSGFEPADFEAAGAVSGHESTYNHSNYNTAYGWGNHASAGYFNMGSHTLDNIPDGTTYKLVTAAEKSALHAAGSDDSVTVAEETTDTECFINFTTAKIGDLQIKTNDALKFNSNTGVLTFSEIPILPSEDPTTDYQAASKKYVDDNAGGGVPYTGATSDVDLGGNSLTCEELIIQTYTGSSEPSGFENYKYKRKVLDINKVKSSSGTISKVALGIHLPTADQITAGKIQANKYDIKFYDATNEIEIPYKRLDWYDLYNEHDDTAFHLDVENLDTTGIELWAYYGGITTVTEDPSCDDPYIFAWNGTDLTQFSGDTANFSVSSSKITRTGTDGDKWLTSGAITTPASGVTLFWKQEGSSVGYGQIGLQETSTFTGDKYGFIEDLSGTSSLYKYVSASFTALINITPATGENMHWCRQDGADNKCYLFRYDDAAGGNATDSAVTILGTNIYLSLYSYKAGETFREIYLAPYSSAEPHVEYDEWDDEIEIDPSAVVQAKIDTEGNIRYSPTTETGWVLVSDTWYDASTSSITVPSGAASRYSVGMKIRIKQTSYKYFFITKVEDTTLTVWGGTDYTVADADITEAHFSMMKSPLGFPMDPAKWSITSSSFTQQIVSDPAYNLAYNPNNITITVPIGSWKISLKNNIYSNRIASRTLALYCMLSSTAVTSSTPAAATEVQGFTETPYMTVSEGSEIYEAYGGGTYAEKFITLTASQQYWACVQAAWNGTQNAGEIKDCFGGKGTILTATLAYL
jgi:hypothetical protein